MTWRAVAWVSLRGAAFVAAAVVTPSAADADEIGNRPVVVFESELMSDYVYMMASPGGAVDPIRNPAGLRSRLCGAALVGTLSFKFGISDLKN